MDFPEAFRRSLAACGLSQNKAGPLLGCSGPFVNHLCRGKAKPPLDRVPGWADILGLVGDDRAAFIEAARLAHTPPEIRAAVAALREAAPATAAFLDKQAPGSLDAVARVAALEQEVAELRARLNQINKLSAPEPARRRVPFQFPVNHATPRDDAAKQRAASGVAPYSDDLPSAIPAGSPAGAHSTVDR